MTETDKPVDKPTPHPAKYSAEILEVLDQVLHEYVPIESAILDPFGGVGLIHKFGGWDASALYDTYAVEIEPEWASQSLFLGPTWCGDFFEFHPRWVKGWPRKFQAVVTSPTYANRMADSHNARDDSTRITYKHKLGRHPTEGSSATMQWGGEYKMFHSRAWRRCDRHLLEEDAHLIINVKNHIRAGQEMPVVEWHINRCLRLGMLLVEDRFVPTPGMRFGENHKARVEGEHVLVFKTAPF